MSASLRVHVGKSPECGSYAPGRTASSRAPGGVLVNWGILRRVLRMISLVVTNDWSGRRGLARRPGRSPTGRSSRRRRGHRSPRHRTTCRPRPLPRPPRTGRRPTSTAGSHPRGTGTRRRPARSTASQSGGVRHRVVVERVRELPPGVGARCTGADHPRSGRPGPPSIIEFAWVSAPVPPRLPRSHGESRSFAVYQITAP